MKNLKLIFTALIFALGASAFAQKVVIDENFQSFKEEGFRPTESTDCRAKKVHSKSKFKVEKEYDGNKVEYIFKKCGVAPGCDAKKTPMNDGVTTGYVEVRKDGGEFTVSEQKYISTVEISASATGDARGFALYKSVDGADWVKIGEYIGSKAEGADSQYGFTATATVNEKNVALKFAPVECGKDLALQTFRVHNIKAMGK